VYKRQDYKYEDSIKEPKKYNFQTARNGNNLLRISKSTIETSSYLDPEKFKIILNCNCQIDGNVTFSTDSTQIIYTLKDSSSKFKTYVSDLEGNKTEIKNLYPGNIVAFDAKDKKIAIGAFGSNSAMRPQIITYDSSGNITNKDTSKAWDFLDIFSNDFKYVYIQTYGKNYENVILKYNLKTGKTEQLLETKDGSASNFINSPSGNKLAFLVSSEKTNYLYVLNLENNTIIKKDLRNSYTYPEDKSVWSPNERYIYLDGASCSSGVCSISGSAYYLDISSQEIMPFYKTKGNSEQKDDNNYHEIEVIDFIGWLNSIEKDDATKAVNNSNQKLITFTPSILPSATPVPVINASDWKTYNGGSISFKYPGIYTVKEDKPNIFIITKDNIYDGFSIDASLTNGLENYQNTIDSYKKLVTDINQFSNDKGTKITATMQGVLVRAEFIHYKNGAIAVMTIDPNITDKIFDQFVSGIVINSKN